jgi:GTPase SAR1 family protein
VGLKSDLRHKKTCIDLLRTQGLTPVTSEQGKKVADKINAIYMECSSKERDGVEELFELAIDTAVQPDILEEQDRNTSWTSGRSTRRIKNKKRSCKLL